MGAGRVHVEVAFAALGGGVLVGGAAGFGGAFDLATMGAALRALPPTLAARCWPLLEGWGALGRGGQPRRKNRAVWWRDGGDGPGEPG